MNITSTQASQFKVRRRGGRGGGFRVSPPDNRRPHVIATIDEAARSRALLLRAPIHPKSLCVSVRGATWSLLAVQATFPTAVKLAGPLHSERVCLAAEAIVSEPLGMFRDPLDVESGRRSGASSAIDDLLHKDATTGLPPLVAPLYGALADVYAKLEAYCNAARHDGVEFALDIGDGLPYAGAAFGESSGDGKSIGELSPAEISALCCEAGWPGFERSEGVSIPVGGDKDRFTARIVPCAAVQPYQSPQIMAAGALGATTTVHEGVAIAPRLAAHVELAECESPSDASREAIGRFLLAGAALIRFARPVRWIRGSASNEKSTRHVLGFELPSVAATPESLDIALSALSVAASRCGRELHALLDERVAAQYLKLCGASA